MEPILRVEHLKKVYPDGTEALREVDFTVHPGEFVAVIGPSGSGKSTLLRCVNRLVEPTQGAVIFKGENITRAGGRRVRRLRREIGMVFQSHNLIPRVSVLQNVLHGRLGYKDSLRGALGMFSAQEKEDALRILERMGLLEQAHKRADELSGGQQQRVGIARALAQKPILILADEPIANLDPATSESIMDHLHTICRADGITCLVNLHQVAMAKKYATRIIGIHRGTKVFDGPPSKLDDRIIGQIYYQEKAVV
ncbi:phosphonate ABC transporter ATP-binding protein [Kyrpidia spormannii]|uniref:Phosphonate ABC transporter ATP-binding protein n=1 Tax=Kyrpidia spormannii TaxID=2055160 RepID=A0A2K8N9Z5_9BACL|nr:MULTISPECIES: phosphonate ABC transporter ATP-binding protein [Kyrpidia]ATY86134.1 phosphonate ABC transporter ATP-binding protein [Kyrpidia spormannii]MCL6577128.1 phosphonate ABC transporter ATP-binding protein [Kyrpidia sp.]